MKGLTNRAFVTLNALVFALAYASSLWAREFGAPPTDEEAAQAAVGCMACSSFILFFVVIAVVVNIAMLVWVARDAKSRGMDGAAIWMIFTFLAGPVGLIIYIFSRPQGNMIQCPHCKNQRLQASAKCPHCNRE